MLDSTRPRSFCHSLSTGELRLEMISTPRFVLPVFPAYRTLAEVERRATSPRFRRPSCRALNRINLPCDTIPTLFTMSSSISHLSKLSSRSSLLRPSTMFSLARAQSSIPSSSSPSASSPAAAPSPAPTTLPISTPIHTKVDDKTTHFGFKTVPESQKESLGEAASSRFLSLSFPPSLSSSLIALLL